VCIEAKVNLASGERSPERPGKGSGKIGAAHSQATSTR
jgi:hypothetical protein